MKRSSKYLILITSATLSVAVVVAKLIVHWFNWDFLALTSLHTGVIAGGLFVISFVLSTALGDYKESERLPAEFAATVESMYEDAAAIANAYPGVDLDGFRSLLVAALDSLRDDVVEGTRETHHTIFRLSVILTAMEREGVPPNFIVKLKQEQSVLIRGLFRINYIQSIKFVPSAYVLAQTVSAIVLAILVFTAVDPVATGIAVTGLVALVFIYILRLIRKISQPFQPKGSTVDDVSLFLIDRTRDHLLRGNAHEGH